jgi:hypothetical protein
LLFLRRPSFSLGVSNLLPSGSGQGPLLGRFTSGQRRPSVTIEFSRPGEQVSCALKTRDFYVEMCNDLLCIHKNRLPSFS